MVTRSTPPSNRWVAKQCRSVWMPLPLAMPAFLFGEIIDFLCGTDVQRLISALAKENPGNRLIRLLIFFQLAEQPLGENRIAVFFPFALFHPNHHALNVDIADFEMDQLVDSKTRLSTRSSVNSDRAV